MSITLHPMTPADQSALEAALAPYLAEIVPGQTLDIAGIAARQFGPARHPFWILRGDTRIGFALAFTHDDGTHELAEFTIFPDHRRAGTGRDAARRVFARLPGRWVIGVAAHGMAGAFWEDALAQMPDLKKGPGLTPSQSHSYTFTADGGDAR